MVLLPFSRPHLRPIIKRFARRTWLSLLESRAGRALDPINTVLTVFGLGTVPNRFVLTIGDEGATLVKIRHGRIDDALFVGPETEEGPEMLRSYFEAEQRAPVLVVADVLEQMYREDSIPRVSPFDRGAIVRRRLEMTFPNETLRAALTLPRKKGLRQQWVLFTALPTTPNLERWIEFLETLRNPVEGFALLPLEAVGLAAKLTPSSGGDPRKIWRALVIHQASSGVRQIIEKDGRFIVTRLTQKAEDMTVDGEAMLLERELRASLSYVKRLGYVEFDRLDVVVLTDPVVGRAIADRDLPATSVTVLTPYQAAYLAGLGDTGREDSPFSDILMSVWMAASAGPKIILPSAKIRDRLQLGRVVRIASFATLIVTLLTLVYAASSIFDYFDAADAAQLLQSDVARAEAQLAAQRASMEKYPIPFDQLRQIAAAEQSLVDRQVNPVEVLRNLAATLGPALRLEKVTFQTSAQSAGAIPAPPPPTGRPRAAAVAPVPAIGYQIAIVVRFTKDSEADPDTAVRDAKDYLARLGNAFPGHSVSVVRLPVSLLSNQALEGSAGPGTSAEKSAPVTAEYLIRKGAG